MSFLIDPPLLVAGGAAYARADGPAPRAAAAATLAVFWSAGAAFWADRPWTRAVSRRLGARDGRDFMVNSGVLAIRFRPRSRRTQIAALAAFATYPLWLLLGWMIGRS